MNEADLRNLAQILAKVWSQALAQVDRAAKCDFLEAGVTMAPATVTSTSSTFPWVLAWIPTRTVVLVRNSTNPDLAVIRCQDPTNQLAWQSFLVLARKEMGLASFRDLYRGLVELAHQSRQSLDQALTLTAQRLEPVLDELETLARAQDLV